MLGAGWLARLASLERVIASDTPYTLVTDQQGLAEAVDVCRSARSIAIDTESDSRHRYPERVCLVQLGASGRVFIIDPLAVEDMSPLGSVLADASIEKQLHGADYDLRGLHRDWGFTLANIFDTYVVARLAGLEQVGLGSLLGEVLSVDIPKDPRLQKQDWSRRPLTDEALAYAASDVAYLGALRDALAAKLEVKGRSAWAAEEFERLELVRYVRPDPETALFDMKEARGLDGRGLAVLKALVDYRQDAAVRATRPPAFLIPGPAMAALAANPSMNPAEAPSMTPGSLRRFGDGIRRAIKDGLRAPEIQRPPQDRPRGPRPSRAEQARAKDRLQKLKAWRTAEALRLEVDPALVWPMRSLERLARDPSLVADESATPDARHWQVKEFAESLAKATAGLTAERVEAP